MIVQVHGRLLFEDHYTWSLYKIVIHGPKHGLKHRNVKCKVVDIHCISDVSRCPIFVSVTKIQINLSIISAT